MSPLTIIGLALAASVAVNALQARMYLVQRDELTVATKDRDDARSLATACSDATADLRTLADQRAADAKAARQAADAQARGYQQAAQIQLSTPAAVPGDDCRSAQIRAQTWLQGRAKP